MTPPDHIMAGFSIGAVYASICGLFQLKRLSYLTAFFLCGVFAILPDADAFSGVYSSTNPFIGHRGITHSIFFVVSVSAIFTVMYSVPRRLSDFFIRKPRAELKMILWKDIFILIFFSGFSHLLMDLPQIPGIWKGIPLFFPAMEGNKYLRSGGWGNIGWYDYRVTWVLFISVLLSFTFLTFASLLRKSIFVKIGLSVVVLIISVASAVQITGNIMKSAFKSTRDWNESQRLYLETFPPVVKRTVRKGRVFISGVINR